MDTERKANRAVCLGDSSKINAAINAPNRKDSASRIKRDGPSYPPRTLLYSIDMFLNG
jgi:hypothetical protein